MLASELDFASHAALSGSSGVTDKIGPNEGGTDADGRANRMRMHGGGELRLLSFASLPIEFITYLRQTFSADGLLAHLALGAAGEEAEAGLLADEAQLKYKNRVGSRFDLLSNLAYPSFLHVLPDAAVDGLALELGLGQRRPDVRHLVQSQVQRLHGVSVAGRGQLGGRV